MIGETIPASPPVVEGDVVADLKEWIERGSIPLHLAKRALAELERLRGLAGAVSAGQTFDEIRRMASAGAPLIRVTE